MDILLLCFTQVIQVHNLKCRRTEMCLKFCLELYLTHSSLSFFSTDGQCVKNSPVRIHNLQTAWHPHGITLFSVLWVHNLHNVLASSTSSYLTRAGQHATPQWLCISLFLMNNWNGSAVINLFLSVTLLVSTLVKLSWGWSNIF